MKFLLLLLLSVMTNMYPMKKQLYIALAANDILHVDAILKQCNSKIKSNLGDYIVGAALSGNLALLETFYKNGVKLDQGDRCGGVAIVEATKHNKIDMVKFLIHLGVPANTYDGGLMDAYEWAKIYKRKELKELLEPLRTPMDPSWTLCKK